MNRYARAVPDSPRWHSLDPPLRSRVRRGAKVGTPLRPTFKACPVGGLGGHPPPRNPAPLEGGSSRPQHHGFPGTDSAVPKALGGIRCPEGVVGHRKCYRAAPVRLLSSAAIPEGRIPNVKDQPPYRGPTLGQERIDVQATNVGGCLRAVGARYPGFDEQIFDAAGVVHRFVMLFLNGEEIDRAALDTPVSDADEVRILAAIAGG